MKVEHKGSHKASRTELLKSPPTFGELIHMIKNIPNLTKEEKAFFGIAITTGSRVSEICNVKYKDIKFRGPHGNVLEHNQVLPWSSDIAKVNIVFNNLKNKKVKYKNGSLIRSTLFMEPIEWIADRYREIGPGMPDTNIYTKGRKCAYWLVKRLGDDWFPHIFRHYYISNLIRDGVSPAIVKTAAGWASLDNLNTYLHLSTKELENELNKYYGDNIPIGVPNRPLSMHQMIGAVAAKIEVKKGHIPSEKNQPRKMSVVKIDDQLRAIRLTKEARAVRDQLKNKEVRPIIQKKVEEVQDNDILQIV